MAMLRVALCVLFIPSAALAQPSPAEKQATLTFIASLRDPETGAFAVNPPKPGAKPTPSLRACNGAIRAIHYLGGKLDHPEKIAAFVLKCYDPATGAFAEPGGKPDGGVTAVGVMAAVELGIPEAKFPKAVEYLHRTAKTFEEVRIGAAALESLNKRPDWLGEWFKIADAQLGPDGTAGTGDGVARDTGSVIAMKLRLGIPRRQLANADKLDDVLQAGQRADGGYGEAGAAGSDLGSTYRVMRAFVLLKERPKDRPGMRAFVAKCRNADGGYGVQPGQPSSMSGVYYAAIIGKWLDEMEGK